MARFALPGLQRLAALTGVALAVACAVAPLAPPAPPAAPASASQALPPPPAPPSAGPSVSIPLPPPPLPPSAFEAFLGSVHTLARTRGIAEETWAAATAGLAPIPAITAMNDNQPEFSRAVWAYLDGAVSARRIRDGQFRLNQQRATLDGVAAQSGVPQEILVALWGIETDFGAGNGSYNLFAALATLGSTSTRQDFAREEFLAALKILQDQHYTAAEMKSSWAGAFGQSQFTPTTFLKYATDGDGDGRIDLWNSPADALASAASLLAGQGWRKADHWAMEVKLPRGFAYEDADVETAKPLGEWRRRGVVRISGNALPAAGEGAIYLPAGAKGPAFLLFPNFNVILKYNNAASYALAVSVLADRIMGRPGVKADWPRGERQMSRDERLRYQQALAVAGFDPGTPDGVLGRRTRAATRDYQKKYGLTADGYPSADLLAAMAPP